MSILFFTIGFIAGMFVMLFFVALCTAASDR